MKIAPLKVSDPWYGRILNNGEVQADALVGVPIESTVEMELVELLHEGPENNYRPYLHLRGELIEVKPAVELPYGVSELALRRGGGLNVDAFYDFSPRQLVDLVDKGYFTPEFKVPTEMSGIPWVLPGKADFLVVAPELFDQPPVVFMNVHEQSELELDEANSGYDLSAYFPDYTPQAQEQAETVEAEAVASPEHDGSGLDMFSDVEFEEQRSPVDRGVAQREVEEQDQRASVPSGVFSRLVEEIESQRVQPEPAEESEQEAIVPGSPEDVYLSRVSPGVEQVLSPEQIEAEIAAEAAAQSAAIEQQEADHEADEPDTALVQTEAAPSLSVLEENFLDLSEPEPELAPLPVVIGEADGTSEAPEDSEQAQRKAAVRRTARIRSELSDDETPASGDENQPVL